MNERDIYEYAMDRLAAGADAERVIQELTGAQIDSSRVRDIVGIASLAIIRRDHYEVLGVPRAASNQEIRLAFRQKALQYHPDHNVNPGAAGRFKQLNDIYKTLSDPCERIQYDRSIGDATDTFTIGQSEGTHSSAYRRQPEQQSQPTGTHRRKQTTHEDVEVEESWCEIFANLAVQAVIWAIAAFVGAIIGFAIVRLVFRLWNPWD